jgi:hypothetical protein
VRSRYLALLLTISVIVSGTTLANAAGKSGSKCTKLGAIAIESGKKFTCIKSGGKYIWDKGTVYSSPKIPSKSTNLESYRFSSLCEKDPFVPEEWKLFETFSLRRDTFNCASAPLRFKLVTQPITTPSTPLTPNTQLNPVNECKISHGRRSGGQIAFSTSISPQIFLNKRANVQVIPVEFMDFPSKNSVAVDHEKYFKYIKDGHYNLSDGQVSINFRVPTNYIKVNKRIDSYILPGTFSHGGPPWVWPNMDMNQMLKDISTAIGSSLDLSDNDLAFIVVPPTTDNQYIGHGWPGSPIFRTEQGLVHYWYFSPPMSLIERKSWYGANPWLHIHEMQHSMNKLDDHYGDGDFGRIDGDAGTGNWGHMSGMRTDFLFWDKWISLMVSDDQVICANPQLISTHWIKPSNYFGKTEKLLVIPISSTKVIVVESMRAAGFNFKLPEVAEGALVYIVDTSITSHGRGINVLRPTNRTGSIYSRPDFILADAPLKVGESLLTNGFKISVVEAGKYGDVVKVEKIA